MNKKIIIPITKFILLLFGTVLKAIWNSAITVVSLFAYSILLIALVSYYGMESANVNQIIDLVQSLMKYWSYFFIAFILLYLYDSKWRFRP